MNGKELNDLFKGLKEQGWNPQLCDTPIPVSLATAQCGIPTEMGDEYIDDYILLPKALVGNQPEMLIPAKGDSMRDAGYEEGDLLRVRFGMMPRDNDNVLARIDDTFTVKTLFTDEDGVRWLVPQNEKYDAIQLTEEMDVSILGVVVYVEKMSTRASSRALLTSIRRTKNKQRKAIRLSEDEVNKRIVEVSSMVKHARQWYAVYRAMTDYEVAQGGISEFCERIRRLLPEHEHLPEQKELSRMAVQSFAKPVAMWQMDNAPVGGSRYRDYLNIALAMGNLLGSHDAPKTPTQN